MDIFEEIVRLRQQGRKAVLATIVHTQGSIPSFQSSKLLVRDDGSIAGTVGGGCVEAEVWAAAQEVMREEKPRKLTFNLNADPRYDVGLTCGGTLEIYVEPILPQPLCYLFGGGHVSLAIARIATQAGFAVIVIDDRPRFSNRERFPEAAAVYADEYEKVFPQLDPNESSYIVIVTRGHKDDMRVLRWAAGTRARYIGMIGSKRKVLSIYKVLESEGIPRDRLERVRAPIGIDIGAITPEEIGVSIVAEMIAVRRNAPRPGSKTVGTKAHTATEEALKEDS
ncbi:MAG: XdhC family protein [Acidobacteria bacterium]|nr:XdhC family protein [Acidobacteriota bacterium]